MALTEREQRVWNEIQGWQYQLSQQDSTDFQMLYDKWVKAALSAVPEEKREAMFTKADQWLFHLHAFIQSSQSQLDARSRILSGARMFDESIEHIEQLRTLTIDQLIYIAEQQMARHRLYSFVQGGATGAGGFLLIGADFPLVLTINLKAVQLIATTYGYDVNKPYEMMIALKVFHAAILPTRLQRYAWHGLLDEIHEAESAPFFYGGEDQVVNAGSLQAIFKQVIKVYMIHTLRRKLVQGIPLLGIAVGSTVNYRFTRTVTEFANRFYQMRYLLEKQK